ncbi:MAG: cytochrome c-type biogenesis protein CcmH [Limnochordaceae bacterium]|nr:cytochrome c-type biogenesis protein CcmH [Limnochordaceae bacterium]
MAHGPSLARTRATGVEIAVWSVILLVAVVTAAGLASSLSGMTQETTVEARARAIARELSCPVCEGQSVADSASTVAAQMRAEIRQMLDEGKSESEIIDYYVQQYGTWILARPPATGAYVLLWGAPLLVLAAGAAWAYRRVSGGHRR